MTRYFEDVIVGESLADVHYPINVYRLVMAAGTNRDFNSIHHNSEYAKSTGASEMYANTGFLLGMWERCIRDWMGMDGKIRSLSNFAMKSFNLVGDTTTVTATVIETRLEAEVGLIEIEITSHNSRGLTVGPGRVVVELPRRPSREDA